MPALPGDLSLVFSRLFCYGRLMTKFNMPRPALLVLTKLNARLTMSGLQAWNRGPFRRGNVG